MVRIPFLLLLGFYVWCDQPVLRARTVRRPDTLDIYVVAKQWMWKVAAPGRPARDRRAARAASGEPVQLVMTSQDVIHSFFVPAFRIKQDVLPGRYTELWFTADQAGRVSPVLRRVLRHRPLAHGRAASYVMAAAGLRALARRAGTRDADARGAQGERAVPRSTAAAAATAPHRAVHAPDARRPVTGSPCRSRTAAGRRPTSTISAIRILLPQKRRRRRLRADHAVVRRPVSEDDLLTLVAYIKSLDAERAGDANDARACPTPIRASTAI